MNQLYFNMLKVESVAIFRQGFDLVYPAFLFVLLLILFPLGLDCDFKIIAAVSPAVFMSAFLVSLLFGAQDLFRRDHQNGILEYRLLNQDPLFVWVLSVCMIHFGLKVLPLIFLIPFLGILYHFSLYETAISVVSALLIGGIFTFLMAMLNALVFNLKQASFLLAILCLPLSIPLLIFATSAIASAKTGLFPGVPLAFLGGIFSFTLAIAPPLIAGVLRIGIQSA